MKKYILTFIYIVIGAVLLTSCADFEQINRDPKAVRMSDISRPEWFLNKSMVGAMQNPHIAERIFVICWKSAGRQARRSNLATGNNYGDYFNDYYGVSYLGDWIRYATFAIDAADEQVAIAESANLTPSVDLNNIKQCARIWRAYLYTELFDNFGPISFNLTMGEVSKVMNEKDCYTFALTELKEAVEAMDAAEFSGNVETDHAYKYKFPKWIKYANSMKMRIAMRISNADPTFAKAEFEAAAKHAGGYLSSADDIFQIIEGGGWDDLTAIMNRTYNRHQISTTINNLMINLGGVTTEQSIGTKYTEVATYTKPEDYFGLKLAAHFPTFTNDPSTGFWFDGLHNVMDPRAYHMFQIPGNFKREELVKDEGDWVGVAEGATFDEHYCKYGAYKDQKVFFLPGNGKDERTQVTPNVGDTIKKSAHYAWNAFGIGDWGIVEDVNDAITVGGAPCLRDQFRGGLIDGKYNSRVMFASWESYFLIAEAAVKGWTVPLTAQTAYEEGITASMKYNKIPDAQITTYLASDSYNRVGTSVHWGHIAEADPVEYYYIDGYNGNKRTHIWTKPVNTVSGSTNNNDQMNKIMTQKFIAQTPWLPSETWSDHRRTGLPFFENPAVEEEMQNLPALTQANVKNSNNWGNFPQRFTFPSNFEIANPTGYSEAVQFLEGEDEILTPLWWSKAKNL